MLPPLIFAELAVKSAPSDEGAAWRAEGETSKSNKIGQIIPKKMKLYTVGRGLAPAVSNGEFAINCREWRPRHPMARQ